MKTKIWFYPLSIYVAAAVLFSIGCADENKNKRIAIKSSATNRPQPKLDENGNPIRTASTGGDTDEGNPKNPQEVQSLYEQIPSANGTKVAATGKTTAEQINVKIKDSVSGSLVAVEDIAAGLYEVSGFTLSGNFSAKDRGVRTFLEAKTTDINFKTLETTLYTTAAEEKKAGEVTADKSDKDQRDGKKKKGMSQDESARRTAENRKLRTEGGRRTNPAIAQREQADDSIVRIFSYNYAFGRNIKVEKKDAVSTFEELNTAQINTYFNAKAREAKLIISGVGESATTKETPKLFKEILGTSKPSSDGTYKFKNEDTGAEVSVAFRQDSETGKLQITLTEEHTGKRGGAKVYKSVVISYSKKAAETPAPAKQETPKTPAASQEGEIKIAVKKD